MSLGLKLTKILHLHSLVKNNLHFYSFGHKPFVDLIIGSLSDLDQTKASNLYYLKLIFQNNHFSLFSFRLVPQLTSLV
jgi:hypothetical protein